MLSTLQQKQRPITTPTNAEKTIDPAAISRLPSALIDELDEPGNPAKASPTIIALMASESLSEVEMEAQAKHTMAEMAELEWEAIEKHVRTLLPPRGRGRAVLVPKASNNNMVKVTS